MSQTDFRVRSLARVGAINRRTMLLGTGFAVAGAVTSARSIGATTEKPVNTTPSAGDEPPGTPVGSQGKVVIYSGRNEQLIGGLIEDFEHDTGIEAQVRYGGTAELAATILEEGENSPADLFFSQDAGALGALAKEGRLATLPDDLLNRIDKRYRSDDGVWLGTSARARCAVYNTDQLSDADIPGSVMDLVDSKWKGKLGWAPTNGSFQAFVTAFRLLKGDDVVRDWLQGMLANEPAVFESNGPLTLAVGQGELALGLVNHYYLWEVQAEEGKSFPLGNHFFSGGDPGSLVNVAGIGILKTAAHNEQATRFADFLLGEEAQEYFAKTTFEYPLVADVHPSPGLKPLDEIESPEIDLSDIDDLQGTLALLTETGVI